MDSPIKNESLSRPKRVSRPPKRLSSPSLSLTNTVSRREFSESSDLSRGNDSVEAPEDVLDHVDEFLNSETGIDTSHKIEVPQTKDDSSSDSDDEDDEAARALFLKKMKLQGSVCLQEDDTVKEDSKEKNKNLTESITSKKNEETSNSPEQ